MSYNLNTWYGMAQAWASPFTMWKTFYVAWSAFANASAAWLLYQYDIDWVQRFFNSTTALTDALAQTVAWRGDVIMIDPSYTTWITSTELLAAETKWVSIVPVSKTAYDNVLFCDRATWALPQSTQSALFTVTGRIIVRAIIWQVTTIIQNQVNNTKIVANPTVWTDVDLCATASIANAAVWTNLSITWTLATALQVTASWAFVYQASPVVVMAWTIDLSCSASNTWSVKWKILYQPLDQWALVLAA